MGLLIKNGEIVTGDARYHGDIWCEGETITQIGPGLPASPNAEVIDATGKFTISSTAIASFTTNGSAYSTPMRWPKYLHWVVMRSTNLPQAG